MPNYDDQVQFSVYQTMRNPDPDRLPVVYEKWEEKASEVLKDGSYN